MATITSWVLKHNGFTSTTIFFIAIILTACVSTPASQQKLIAEDGASDDFFGYSVALSGDIAVIGAFKDDDPLLGDDAGSAYVFARFGKVWHQQAKLKAIDGAPNDTFGGNVAVSGNTIIVGSMRDDDRGENSGSAYIFTRSNNIWNHQTKLLAADGAKGNAFGQSVAFSGNSLVIGSPRDDVNGADTGSAYVFTRDGEFWRQQAKLTADDGMDGDLFGISVALSGDTILIGADLHDEIAPDAGAVYVYTRSGNKWSQ